MLIEQEHNGKIIDQMLVHTMRKIYECMGLGLLKAYITDVETPFLEATCAHYQQKQNEWIFANDSIPDFLIKVEKAHGEVQRHVVEYLNGRWPEFQLSTESQFHAVVEDELFFVGFVLLLSGHSLNI